jgi:hypothetical protein
MKNEFDTLLISDHESLTSLEEKTTKLTLDKQYKIRLPVSLNTRGALGVEVALIQLIGTWLKHNKNKKVFHSHQGNTPESFEELCSSIYGIASLTMIDEVWDTKKNKLPKGLVLEKAKHTIESLRERKFLDCFNPRYFGVPYIKKRDYDKEFEMPFYNVDEVIESGAFSRVVEQLLKENICYKSHSRFKSLCEMIEIEDLASTLWEIFKNTHDHGRHDVKGNIISENFRTIIIQQQDITDAYWDKWCGANPSHVQQKFKNIWYGKSQRLSFLDFSVVDFGEGFFELAKNKVDTGDGVEVFMRCMQQGWSRLEGNSRGGGLTKVLNCIQKYKGWLRIRTSNLLLEKTYSENDSSQIERTDIRIMNTYVAGTSVHISLPLPGFNNQ